MYPHQKNKVTTLEEDFKALGLDPEKALGTIERQTRLVEQRIGVPSDPHVSGGEPPVLSVPDMHTPSVLSEDTDAPGASGGHEHQISEDEAIKKAFAMMEQFGDYEQLLDLSDIDPADKEEAMKRVRVKVKTAAEKLANKLSYRKDRAANRMRSMKFRRKNKAKIKRRAAMKRKRFGDKGSQGGKFRIVSESASVPFSDELAELRNELNTSLVESNGNADVSDYFGPFEEAAYNAGVLVEMIAECMDIIGDEQTAQNLYALSDSAADLAESLEYVMEAEDLEEDKEESLRSLLDSCVKALRMYEALGAPSLTECAGIAEARLQG